MCLKNEERFDEPIGKPSLKRVLVNLCIWKLQEILSWWWFMRLLIDTLVTLNKIGKELESMIPFYAIISLLTLYILLINICRSLIIPPLHFQIWIHHSICKHESASASHCAFRLLSWFILWDAFSWWVSIIFFILRSGANEGRTRRGWTRWHINASLFDMPVSLLSRRKLPLQVVNKGCYNEPHNMVIPRFIRGLLPAPNGKSSKWCPFTSTSCWRNLSGRNTSGSFELSGSWPTA